ncbi:MAG: hypothetical protein IJ666_00840 [Ruminococcus sp.]|nr:hypothetical protein [Ruminococcus sp.]
MKKNLTKITAAAFAAAMALGTTGIMAYADEPAEAPDAVVVSDDTPVENPTDVPEETPTDAPEETPTDAPEETPTEALTDAPDDVTVTTVTTEIADISTQTTAAEPVSAETTTAAETDKQLITSGKWRSDNGLYTFDASRASGSFKANDGTENTFTYTLSSDYSVTMNFAGGTAKTGTLNVANTGSFSIAWSDGTSETFSRESSDETATTTTTTSGKSSSSTAKSSSSAPAGKTDSPKTGDNFQAIPIAAFALTGAAVCFMSFRKKDDK